MVAAKTLTVHKSQQNQPYISRRTWQKIRRRQEAHEQGRNEEVKELTQQIKRDARKDKKDVVLNGLNNLADQREKWQGIKGMKKDSMPSFIQMKDLNGKFVAPKDRAETLAQYLEKKHWHNNNTLQIRSHEKIQNLETSFDVNAFQMNEFEQALKRMKNNKQPGPDGIVMELFKWMDGRNRALILNMINQWWSSKAIPGDVCLARVVPIYKKGDIDQPSNYRPISLLNSIYKLYMCLIRNRLQVVLDPTLSNTQYGFRPSRSTSHAIFLTRRAQDIAEQRGTNLVITFLDWEKAFDRIQHDRMAVALKRLGIHQQFIDVLLDCYRCPGFYVEDEYGKSSNKVQSCGIRQGCPLSPYLFVLVMSVIDHDVGMNITARTKNARYEGVDFDRIYYADDTLLITTNTQASNNLLHEVETVSAQFGLRLNRDKCCYIAMNGNNVIKFADGTRLARVNEATYLGHQITQAMDIRHEINHKMHQTLKLWYRLNTFWRAINCPKHWKLQVYDAVIKNKLLYGLETVHLTQAMQKRVNAFQLRGLRKILGMTTTFVNRANTNEKVIQKANEELVGYRSHNTRIKLFSNLLMERRAKLAGHILRTPSFDPLRQVSYQPDSAQTFHIGKRRVGGPRQNWLFHTNRFIWETYVAGPCTPYTNASRQNDFIYERALDRHF